jgi:hypothetical protein
MNLLINQDDLIHSLARRLMEKKFQTQTDFDWTGVDAYVKECQDQYRCNRIIVIDFNQVNKLINKQISAYKQKISAEYKNQIKPLIKYIRDNDVLNRFPAQWLLSIHMADQRQTFIKTLGPQLSDHCNFITTLRDADPDQPFLIRNVIHNESLLQLCMKHSWPFWFIDSGYTNFLNDKRKTWHRLVQNHIHHGPATVDYPSDRLHMLPAFPRSWRKKGRKILVVESSESHYRMMGTTIEQWRQHVERELRLHTGRDIEFRAKEMNKKTRTSVYDLLSNSKDYHCVVSDCSNAATESLWAGVPVITLRRHITNSVSRNNLCDVENLYRDDLESWLRAVSYNQFTFEELCDGTAVEITKTYGSL